MKSGNRMVVARGESEKGYMRRWRSKCPKLNEKLIRHEGYANLFRCCNHIIVDIYTKYKYM
jgi:hypothetical protein